MPEKKEKIQETPVELPPVEVKKGELYVRTDEDTYIFKVPTGSEGWKHLRIMMEVEKEKNKALVEMAAVEGKEVKEVKLTSEREQEIIEVALDKWVEKVLPFIGISHKFEDLPWYEIMNIFQAIVQNMSIDTANFRDLEQ